VFIPECNVLLAILIFRTNCRTYCMLEGRMSVQEFNDTCSQPMQVSRWLVCLKKWFIELMIWNCSSIFWLLDSVAICMNDIWCWRGYILKQASFSFFRLTLMLCMLRMIIVSSLFLLIFDCEQISGGTQFDLESEELCYICQEVKITSLKNNYLNCTG